MAGELKAEISKDFVTGLADGLGKITTDFAVDQFVQSVLDSSWETLELKARIHHVAHQLGVFLPNHYPDAIEVLKTISGEHGGLQSLIFPDFVEQFGLEYWDESMCALAEFTSLSSSEFAVRPFIRLDEGTMMAQMLAWADSDNFHIRRLASEGCRSRLPWASPLRRFIADPEPVLPILEKLKDDPEIFVRRSVANNLNDISKDHPALALELSARWIGESEEVDWVVKHGLRTLLKQGDTKALQLFGYGSPSNVSINSLNFSGAQPLIGASTYFEFDLFLSGKEAQKLRIEYEMFFLKANGSLSRKVFQIRESAFEPGKYSMAKKHSFRQMTTRKHYPGRHELAVCVNGQELARVSFDLLP